MKSFKTEQEAKDWIQEDANDPCVDNVRFAFLDDLEAVAEYNDQQLSGCCGSLDKEVFIDGRKALVGCNYGH